VVLSGLAFDVDLPLAPVDVIVDPFSPVDVDIEFIISAEAVSDVGGKVEVPVCAATGQVAVLATLIVASGM
jgi:hypothetical protein